MTATGTASAAPVDTTGAAHLAGPTDQEWAAAVHAVQQVRAGGNVLLVCHVNPDGDALGSMLGFLLGLRGLGHTRVQATFPGRFEVPEPLRDLPGLDLLAPPDEVVAEPDLVISFDAASIERLGEVAARMAAAPCSIVLDHHASNPGFGSINLIAPRAAATSVVADELLRRLGAQLDRDMAECLYVALATDTGSFRFDATTVAVHEFAARLIATGIRPAQIARRVFDSRPFGAVRLYGDVLGRAELEPAAAGGRGLVWTYATLDDLARHQQRPYVLEGLIDDVRCAEEAEVACVLKQVRPTEWAVSLRSRGAVDVGRVAVRLGGGGHPLAAGFTWHGERAAAMDAIRAALDDPTTTDAPTATG